MADHPRSRGVYLIHVRREQGKCGSSPLARGLLVNHFLRRDRRGIIPARAGFTVKNILAIFGHPDHPRSRGVYPPVEVVFTPIHGSSPLARGLPAEALHVSVHDGIIPARAGFTWRGRRGDLLCRDHPRSRGVYSS